MLASPSILLTAAVTILAVVLYMYSAIRVWNFREKHNISAPTVIGHPEFERAYRVQMNTLEAMPVFLPALWLASIYFTKVGLLAPAIGLVWVVGRIVYMQAYMADPSKRGLGFGMSALSQIALLLLAIAGVAMAWSAAAAT
jgi:glutathione S-transferase